ncbi:hypothetical protein KQX54_019034 [Cotesia glomerata]|uniref:Single domain-containing protein n=1 Tax=Cotesia glomerata TaxID=32391 RepID=A0AAV7HX54_COTGL|nr:hypothetical protein KQX54_019034 [Cotesia glomerata]
MAIKLLLFVFCMFVAIQLSVQKSQIGPDCTDSMLQEVKEHIDECFLITCSSGKARIVACMNDICPPGQMPVGREPNDNTKTYPGCCGQLICVNVTGSAQKGKSKEAQRERRDVDRQRTSALRLIFSIHISSTPSHQAHGTDHSVESNTFLGKKISSHVSEALENVRLQTRQAFNQSRKRGETRAQGGGKGDQDWNRDRDQVCEARENKRKKMMTSKRSLTNDSRYFGQDQSVAITIRLLHIISPKSRGMMLIFPGTSKRSSTALEGNIPTLESARSRFRAHFETTSILPRSF